MSIHQYLVKIIFCIIFFLLENSTIFSQQIYKNCKEILEAFPSSTSGVYLIDPDGGGLLPEMQCQCDMETDGGGWTLVLNYNHLQGTNPPVQVRNTLPLIGSTSLGIDESGNNPNWGHISNSIFNTLNVNEIRFYAKTSNHNRIIDFKTSHQGTIDYFRTGIGSTNGLSSDFTPLANHTANLPTAINLTTNDKMDLAMTEYPMWTGNTYHWYITASPAFTPNGNGRWEVDDYNFDLPSTYHQIWVRSCEVNPAFNITSEYCENQTPDILPQTSLNGISGMWFPSEIITDILGATSYTFTPEEIQCAMSSTVNITISGIVFSDTSANACGSFNWYGTSYSTSGNYTHTLQSTNGCDSIITLNLTITNTLSSDTSANACGSFNWYGTSYNTSGNYTHTLQSINGCDSIVTLNLTITNALSSDTSANACGSFNWYGTSYSTSGNYTHTLQSTYGCDSIITLNLTITNTLSSDTSATSCGSFNWYGTSYSASGNYTHTLQSTNGCDSIVTLDLVIFQIPKAKFSSEKTEFNQSDTEIHFYNQSIGANYYQWKFSNGIESNEFELTHNFSNYKAGIYPVYLMITSENGCSDSFSLLITIKDETIFFIPNSFTPNGDEKNNVFKPIIHSVIKPESYELMIFNRWGELLFESNNSIVGWDGTFNNIGLVKSDTYVWVLKFLTLDGKIEKHSGSLNLIR